MRKAPQSKNTVTSGSTTKGILFILLAAFFFSLMTVFVRLSGDLPTMQKAFFRNVVAAAVAFLLLLRSGNGFSVQRKNIPALFMRCSTISR